MTSTKMTVIHSKAMHSSSLYLKKNEDRRFLLNFEDFRRKGLDYGAKVVDNNGGNMS